MTNDTRQGSDLPHGYRTIVVGTDGSDLAAPTVARAAWLAAHEGADLVVVCAWTGLSRRAEAKNVTALGADASQQGQVQGREAAKLAVDRAVTRALAAGAHVTGALLIEADPSAALLQVVRDRQADLLVVGAIQDISIAERLLGTVASEVVRRATCEVLIVRPREGVRELPVPQSAS